MEEETLLKKEIDEHLRMLANCESSKNYSWYSDIYDFMLYLFESMISYEII